LYQYLLEYLLLQSLPEYLLCRHRYQNIRQSQSWT